MGYPHKYGGARRFDAQRVNGGLERPIAGVHLPGALGEVRARFPDDEACLDYLVCLRWGDYGRSPQALQRARGA